MNDIKNNAMMVFERIENLLTTVYQHCSKGDQNWEAGYCTVRDAFSGEKKNFEESCCNEAPCCNAAA